MRARIAIECPEDHLTIQEGAVVFLALELRNAAVLGRHVILVVLLVARVVVELGVVTELGLHRTTWPSDDIVGSGIEHSVAVVIGIVWP